MAARRALSDLMTRQALARTAAMVSKSELTPQLSGNVSARGADGFLITPSGLKFDALKVGDLVEIAGDGGAKGRLKPSSE